VGRLVSLAFGTSGEAIRFSSEVELMQPQEPRTGSEEVARLGATTLVCRISRKTLFWEFILASLPCAIGVALFGLLLKMLLDDWSRDPLGAAVLLAAGVLSLWGGRVLWRKTNRLRHVQATVHTGGVSWSDGNTCLTCSWDQVEDVRWQALNHYEKTSIAIGGVVPISPGVRSLTHTTHRVTVYRKDGVQLVFTNELQNIVDLARAIEAGVRRGMGGL
jgi:hypothetical protein